MTSATLSFDTLPVELFTIVTDFLLGTDLVPLSHVNRMLLNELLTPNSFIWEKRLPPANRIDAVTAKARYCKTRSYRFTGNAQGPGGLIVRGGAIALPYDVVGMCSQGSFSVSLWFAMLPSRQGLYGAYTGGNLLGAQSIQWHSSGRPLFSQQFIHVDPNGGLCCSFKDTKRVVASKLQDKRWYHVVLTYDQSGADNGTQSVFLDGQLVDSSTGSRHHEWFQLPCWYLGGSCGGPRLPSETRWGWFAFRGLIDDFRVCRRVLSAEEIKCEHKCGIVNSKSVVWSLQEDQTAALVFGDVRRVRCSRPREVYVCV